MADKKAVAVSYEAPRHLSERSKGLWRDVVPRRAESPERVLLVETALEALDRADACRAVIDREGFTVTSKRSGMTHVHPLLKTENDTRRTFSSIWLRLNLDVDLHGQVFEDTIG